MSTDTIDAPAEAQTGETTETTTPEAEQAAAPDAPAGPEAAAPPPPANLPALRQNLSLPAKVQYANLLADSGLLPKAYRKQPANVLWALEYGEMLRLPAMAAMTGVHVIEGKPTASAGLISALVRRAGHKLRITGTNKQATCQIIRCDDPGFTYEVTWTLRANSDDNPSAEVAQLLGKEVWQKYPAAMLKSRAITQCARDACEEALFGLHYTPEELGAEVDEDGNVVGGEIIGGEASQARRQQDQIVDAEIVDADPWQTSPCAPVTDLTWLATALKRAATVTEGNYKQLWQDLKTAVIEHRLTGADQKLVQGIINARITALREGKVPDEPVTDVDELTHLCDELIPAATTLDEAVPLMFAVAGLEAAGRMTGEHADQARALLAERISEISGGDAAETETAAAA